MKYLQFLLFLDVGWRSPQRCPTFGGYDMGLGGLWRPARQSRFDVAFHFLLSRG